MCDICAMEKSYWHICTDGLAREIIFKDVRDYIFGMNGVPALSLSYDITVLAFCLMSNHVHFVVHGVEKGCRAFITAYKKRLSLIADVGMADICVKQIDTDDYLLRVIGYVLRNPVGAGLGVMPQFYRWSSASLYFNKDRVVDGITVEDVGTKKMRGILRSHYRLPSDYIVTTDGMVDPSCYVDYRAVESLFGHVGRMLYFLSRNDDMEMELTENHLSKSSYSDEELAVSVRVICREKFGCDSPDSLSVEARYSLASILRKRYGLGPKQLARLTGTDPQLLRGILHKK